MWFKLCLTTQNARALTALNRTEFLMSEIRICVSAQNCHSQIFQSAKEEQQQIIAKMIQEMAVFAFLEIT